MKSDRKKAHEQQAKIEKYANVPDFWSSAFLAGRYSISDKLLKKLEKLAPDRSLTLFELCESTGSDEHIKAELDPPQPAPSSASSSSCVTSRGNTSNSSSGSTSTTTSKAGKPSVDELIKFVDQAERLSAKAQGQVDRFFEMDRTGHSWRKREIDGHFRGIGRLLQEIRDEKGRPF